MGWFIRKKDDLAERVSSLDRNVRTSFENIKQDMVSLSRWLNNFSQKNYEQDKSIENLEKKMIELWGKMERIESSGRSSSSIERSNDRSSRLNSQPRGERLEMQNYGVPFTHVQSFNRSVQSFMNVQERNNFEILTPAQKRVVGLLAFAGGPLGYEEISNKLNINEVTARRHINDIKRAGIGIRAKMSVNSRRSMFYLDEKVRERLLNIEKEGSEGKKKGEAGEEK